MRRKISFSLIFLYFFTVLVFINLGANIRNMLSPHVIYDTPGSLIYEERVYFILPEGAFIDQQDGRTYLWYIISTDRYPEKSFIAEKHEVEIIKIDSRECIRSDTAALRIIVDFSDELENGMLVNAEKRG